MSVIFSYLANRVNPFAQDNRREELMPYLRRLTNRPVHELEVSPGGLRVQIQVLDSKGKVLNSCQFESEDRTLLVVAQLPEF